MTFTIDPNYRSRQAKRWADAAAERPQSLFVQAMLVAAASFVFIFVLTL